jgi:hypothetical protein
MVGEASLLEAASGSFERALMVFILLFMVGLVWYLIKSWEKSQAAIAATWKESQAAVSKDWEKSTDRIVAKICEVVSKQDKILCKQEELHKAQSDLHEAYLVHDFQAKKIWDNLDNRPCINGKK